MLAWVWNGANLLLTVGLRRDDDEEEEEDGVRDIRGKRNDV